MEESISSSSRTQCCSTTAFHCNNYYHCQLETAYTATAAAAAAAPSDSEDVDSGWTAYFLLASEDEERAPASSQKQLRHGGVCGSASTVWSADNIKFKEKVMMKVVKGEMKKKKKKVEEDPLEDTASSPPLPPGGQPQEVWSIPGCEQRHATSSATEF